MNSALIPFSPALFFSFLFVDMRTYSSSCRCDGEYIISEGDLENGQNIVCCSGCTLSIRVLYNILSDEGTESEDDGVGDIDNCC